VSSCLWEVGLDAVPAAAEDTGARSFGGGAKAEQDAVEEVVGEADDAVRHPFACRGLTVIFSYLPTVLI